ncbi:MAG TPA: hypothetical protein DIS66_03440, partial [Candidatus Omnitrophica bacterium]|nr:hypothetical protein [Candidatus Omnitrophota bacterium]
NIVIFSRCPSPWDSLFSEYFSEVQTQKLSEKDPSAIAKADFLIADPLLLTLALVQKIRLSKNLKPQLRVFALGSIPKEYEDVFDAVLSEACGLFDFTKKVSEKLPLPDSVRLLVADDDPDILSMVSDYFEGRQSPSFEVLRAANGREALEWVQKKRPDAMILDMKMPIMKGSELYLKLQKQEEKIPTIIFFDAISAEDLDIVKKAGAPVIVEKGYRESSMPYLMALVKKLVYFAA